MSLKERINDDVKTAMRAKDAARLSALRLLTAAMKQKEVDERIVLSDQDVTAILEKMIKQRRESIEQFEKAARTDLAQAEKFELQVLASYLPEPLGEAEIAQAISAAVTEAGATGVKDMGKVMALLKPRLAGRADMAKVSAQVKAKLGG
jgi:uncharacterized protein YqeY